MLSSVQVPVASLPAEPRKPDDSAPDAEIDKQCKAVIALPIATAALIGLVIALSVAAIVVWRKQGGGGFENSNVQRWLHIALGVAVLASLGVGVAAAVEVAKNKDLVCKIVQTPAKFLMGQRGQPVGVMAVLVGDPQPPAATTSVEELKLKLLGQSARSAFQLGSWANSSTSGALAWAAVKSNATADVEKALEEKMKDIAKSIGISVTKEQVQELAESEVKKEMKDAIDVERNTILNTAASWTTGAAAIGGIVLMSVLFGGTTNPGVSIAELQYALAMAVNQIENFEVSFTDEFTEIETYKKSVCLAWQKIETMADWVNNTFFQVDPADGKRKMAIFIPSLVKGQVCKTGECCELTSQRKLHVNTMKFKADRPMQYIGNKLYGIGCTKTMLFQQFSPEGTESFVKDLRDMLMDNAFTESLTETPYTKYIKYAPPNEYVYKPNAVLYPRRGISFIRPWDVKVSSADRTSAVYLNLLKLQLFIRMIAVLKDYINIFMSYGLFFNSAVLQSGTRELLSLYAWMLDVIDMSIVYRYDFVASAGITDNLVIGLSLGNVSMNNAFLGCGSLIYEGSRFMSTRVPIASMLDPSAYINRAMDIVHSNVSEFGSYINEATMPDLQPSPQLANLSAKMMVQVGFNRLNGPQLYESVQSQAPQPRTVYIYNVIDVRPHTYSDKPVVSWMAGVYASEVMNCGGQSHTYPASMAPEQVCINNVFAVPSYATQAKFKQDEIKVTGRLDNANTVIYGGGQYFTESRTDGDGNIKPEFQNINNPWVKQNGWFKVTLYPSQWLSIYAVTRETKQMAATESWLNLSYNDLPSNREPAFKAMAGQWQFISQSNAATHSWWPEVSNVSGNIRKSTSAQLVWNTPPAFPGDSTQILHLIDAAHSLVSHDSLMRTLFTAGLPPVAPTPSQNPNRPPKNLELPQTSTCKLSAAVPTEAVPQTTVPAQVLNNEPAYNAYTIMTDHLNDQYALLLQLEGCFCIGDSAESCLGPTLPKEKCQYKDPHGGATQTLGMGKVPFGLNDLCANTMEPSAGPCRYPLCNSDEMQYMAAHEADRKCQVVVAGSLTCPKTGQCSSEQAPNECTNDACFLGNNFGTSTIISECTTDPKDPGCVGSVDWLMDPQNRKSGDVYETRGLPLNAPRGLAQSYAACCENGKCPCNPLFTCGQFACDAQQPVVCSDANIPSVCTEDIAYIKRHRRPGDSYEAAGLPTGASDENIRQFLNCCFADQSQCPCPVKLGQVCGQYECSAAPAPCTDKPSSDCQGHVQWVQANRKENDKYVQSGLPMDANAADTQTLLSICEKQTSACPCYPGVSFNKFRCAY